MRYTLTFVLVLLFTSSCGPIKRLFHGPNYVDREGMRQGRWVYTTVSDPKQVESKGRFKDDRPAGRWKYYNSEKNLLRKEKYKQKEGKTHIKTMFYHPNKQVEKEGWAAVEYTPIQTHYYWFGEWNYYNAAGERIAVKEFVKGLSEPEIIWEVSDTDIPETTK